MVLSNLLVLARHLDLGEWTDFYDVFQGCCPEANEKEIKYHVKDY